MQPRFKYDSSPFLFEFPVQRCCADAQSFRGFGAVAPCGAQRGRRCAWSSSRLRRNSHPRPDPDLAACERSCLPGFRRLLALVRRLPSWHLSIGQEISQLGGRYAHVLDESIETRHDASSGEAWLHGRFTYMLYRW